MAVARSAPVTGPAAAEVSCFHCGLPVPRGAKYYAHIEGISRPTCCPGCQAVAETIAAHGLATYYRHRTALPPRGQQGELPDALEQLRLYDDPDVQRSFVRASGPHVREAALILEGVTCAACVWLNEQHLSQLPGVLSVDINYSTRRAYVRWDERVVALSAILKGVRDIGYSAHPFDRTRFDEVRQRERREALWRIFVAGLGMMQVMMYAYPTYIADGDMSADIESLMRWASLILTAPVVVYSAAPFFSGAWRDLRSRRIGMDVPVALGIAAAFAASVWATFRGVGEVYFDSIAMFVFLLLGGRFLEMNARARASRAAEELLKLIPAFAERLPTFPADRAVERVAVSALRRGDCVLVRPGESIPADGRIVEGETEVDEALLSGESRPLHKRAGDALTGGAVNVTGPFVMRVEKVGQDTVLSGILRLLDRATNEKPALGQLADRVAHWFVGALLVIAAATALAWLQLDPARALWVTVSVLVVSCPCALSLATPVALTVATDALVRLGVVVTRGHALETLARATHVVFDKTGTLTLGRMEVAAVHSVGDTSPAAALRIAGALESGSEHPIAKAILTAAGATKGEALNASALRNLPGQGIEGTVEGRRVRLGTPAFVAQLAGPLLAQEPEDGSTLVALGDERGWLATFHLSDTIRPGAKALVAALAASGREVMLLSGDRESAAKALAANLGIGTVIANATPAEKLACVQKLQDDGAVVAMVGDGVNDAPVLASAAVSIAMGGGTQVAQATSDMILISDRLEHLARAFEISAATRRIVRQNLAWAVAYNAIALPLAVTGHVTPWMAGIGMAASSLLVVLNALRLSASETEARPEAMAAGMATPALVPRALRR